MVMLRLVDDTRLALHERIAAAVRRAIVDGELNQGDLLPRARDVATTFGVHPNTVLRAYRMLRDEGMVDLRAGRGAEVLTNAAAFSGVTELIDPLLRTAARHGLTREDVAAMVSRWPDPKVPKP